MEKKGFCIIESGNKQVLCNPGQYVLIDKISNVNAGDSIDINMIFDGSKIVNKTIKCSIIDPLVKGEKKIIYKMRRRKGYEKKNGFRAQYTKIQIGGNK